MSESTTWSQVEALYRSRFPHFVRVARGVTGDGDAALDAVQEGFVDALRHVEQWEGRGELEAWVWRCVVNRARKQRGQPITSDRALTNGHRADDPDDELRAHLARLPERQRLVVFLRYYADLDYRQIATALGIEVGTVSATLSAAHASLRAQLEGAHR